jgi:redox-sensitive bicupin YhaK (pirin superfamily)
MTMSGAIEMAIEPRRRDLGGGFAVSRLLPFMRRRMVGPFIFLDVMGPVTLAPGEGLDVAPHPHIGLATLTYLLAGEILHRDSLGTVQTILPGAVNWMIAGRGIAHSERTDAALRGRGSSLFGLQSWVALPAADEETAPAFVHVASDALPVIADAGKTVRLVAGTGFGARSPVPVFSPLVYADIALAPGARLPLPAEHPERALLVIEGEVALAGAALPVGRLLVLQPGGDLLIVAATTSRLILLGGEPLEGSRQIWWNFVSIRAERIEMAKADWREGRFPPVVGETERIPLPEGGPARRGNTAAGRRPGLP